MSVNNTSKFLQQPGRDGKIPLIPARGKETRASHTAAASPSMKEIQFLVRG